MEATIWPWYWTYKYHLRSKTPSHPLVWKVGARHCVKTAQTETSTKHEWPAEKARSSHHCGTVRRESLDRKTCRSEKLAERKNSTKPRPNAQSCNAHQNWAVQADSTGGKGSEMERFLRRTQCWNNADTVLAILPTNGREWSYQNNPGLRRHQRRPTTRKVKLNYMGDSYNRATKTAFWSRRHSESWKRIMQRGCLLYHTGPQQRGIHRCWNC